MVSRSTKVSLGTFGLRVCFQLKRLFGSEENRLLQAWRRRLEHFTLESAIAPEPVPTEAESIYEFHILTHEAGLGMTLACLQSFFRNFPEKGSLYIHCDKDFSPASEARLRHHFPNAHIIQRSAADAEITPKLEHEAGRTFRKNGPFGLKAYDIHFFGTSGRVCIFDTDILFLQPLTELVKAFAFEGITTFFEDYSERPGSLKYLESRGLPMVDNINSGLVVLDRIDPNSPRYKQLCSVINQGYAERKCRPSSDQSLLSVYIPDQIKHAFFPRTYSCNLEKFKSFDDLKVAHFHSWSRYLFYSKGLKASMQ